MATRGWVLYDARCPLCRRGARRLGCAVVRRGYRLAPLQRRWVREELARRGGEVPDAMLLLLADGRLLPGVEAYLHLGRRIWWACPFALLGSVPGMGFLLRPIYAWVARHRMGIARTCGMKSCG